MSAHTPGPWKVVVETRPHLDPSYYITALDPEAMGSGRLEVPCHVGLAGGNSRTLSSGRTEANAHLIAAAPEMLEALVNAREKFKLLIENVQCLPVEFDDEEEEREAEQTLGVATDALLVLDAAIAKAEGKR